MGFDVKITTFSCILDLIAPFSCRGCGRLGSLLCECCKNYNIQHIIKICPRCRKSSKKCSCEIKVYAVGRREGVLMKLTEDYKYKSIRKTAEILAELIDAAIPRDFSDEVVVVPLPTVAKHIRERGFDHTLLLAKELARRRGWKVEALISRINKTVQVGADEKTRQKQADKAYAVINKHGSRLDIAKTYLLVDDIWTTGSSMRAAIEAIKKAGAVRIASAVVLIPPE
jgi:competence protein ComFC